MDFTKPEVEAVQQVIVDLEKSEIELGQLELSMVGGGMGDIVLI